MSNALVNARFCGMEPQYWDEDGRQEYKLALLEGCDEEEATRRGTAADNRNSKPRQLKKSVTFAEFWDSAGVEPITLDTRTDTEREESWGRSEEALPLLDYCTDVQRRVLTLRFGLGEEPRMTYRQIADLMGYVNESGPRDRELEALQRIRRRSMGDAGMSDEEIRRRDAKRQRQREWMRKYRAKEKEAS